VQLPVIRGVIDRRILVNYRVDPEVLAGVLPPPFRPKTVHGVGMAGICLIRLKKLRPAFLPAWAGLSSENAAHRVAVEWGDEGGVHEGVYIRRRDTSLWLNAVAGGRLFPGVHHRAGFRVMEIADRYEIAVRSADALVELTVRGRLAAELPESSIFGSTAEASAFFERGSLGYSDGFQPARYQGLELRCREWRAEPLVIDEVHSNVFEDEALFPRGSIEFDCALLMRGIEHEWHGKGELCCPVQACAAENSTGHGAGKLVESN
jgi:hypothetical protein